MGVYTSIYIYIYTHIYIRIHYVFFIYSSICGHLGCFHVLAIVNSAAMNIGVCVSFSIIILSRYMPNREISGPCGNSSFSFLRNFHTVSTVAALTYIPTSRVGRFPFLHTLASISQVSSE